MKKNILFLIPLLFFMTADAQSQEECAEDSCCYEDSVSLDETNFYVKLLGGVNFLQNTKITENNAIYQPGYVIAGSFGYSWRYGLRLEAEYAYRRNDIRKIHFYVEGSSERGHCQSSSYMANLLWDVPLSSWGCAFWNIQPFVGAGIGYDFVQMRSSNTRIVFNQKWSHFSWQLKTGLAYPIFCDAEMTLEYTFHQGSRHFYNHSVGIGLVYKFGFLR